ncbi:MAG: FtsX-like permease family protein [Acidobacteriaceae bacterium]|nr:FtsX-like permease family protein [Acidobacteriaceae bacterium]
MPGVNAATLTDALPMRTISQATYAVDGRTTKPGQEAITDIAHVQDGYFEVLRERLYRGRTFDGHDVREAQPVALVNQAFARENWPDQDAIGKGVYLPDPNGKSTRYSIIGIVSDEHQFGPDAEIHSEVYLPWRALSSPILVVRTKGDPLTMASAVESQLWEIDKEQPISQVDSMESMLHQWTAPRRFNTTVLLSFAAVALLLAAVGLYSVLAYSVGLRTREIGVRVALGAEPKNIIRLIVGQGFLLLALGTAIGLAGAFSLTRFLESLVFGVSTVDPATFMIVAAVLIAVGALASYLPARRAARIDPMGALRAE